MYLEKKMYYPIFLVIKWFYCFGFVYLIFLYYIDFLNLYEKKYF